MIEKKPPDVANSGGFGCLCVALKIDWIASLSYIYLMYSLQFTNTALKALKKAPADISARIMCNLDVLAVAPFEASGVKKLSAREEYRLRVGDWRVLYTLDNNILVVLVVDVAHRREVYR